MLAACRPEGDHCEYGTTRCDGERAYSICKIGGANDDLLGHRSNYWTRTQCAIGTRCIRAGAEIGCADPDRACDPKTHTATSQTVDGNIVVTACSHHIGVTAYLEQSTFTPCDPKTFVRTCHDGQSALACTPGMELRSTPLVVKSALRDVSVEELRFCAVCGDPAKCDR